LAGGSGSGEPNSDCWRGGVDRSGTRGLYLAALEPSPPTGKTEAVFLAHVLYWTMPAVLLVWAVAGWRVRRLAGRDDPVPAAGGRALPRWLGGALLGSALLATLLVAWLLPPAMRMQFDETSLCGTAQGMHRDRVALMTMAAVPGSDGELVPLDWNLDKRPPLFAFLVSVLHDVSGYRLANAFLVNLALLWLLLAGLGNLAARAFGVLGGFAAQCLALGAPLLMHCATSAGFELLAVVAMFAAVVAARAAVAEPRPERIAYLLATLVLTAWTRYEASLAGAALLLWVLRRIGLRALVAPGTRWVWAAGAMLAVPLALLLWQGRDPGYYLEAGGEALLAVGHLREHAWPFLAAWGDFGLRAPLPGLAALLGGFAALLMLLRSRGAALAVLTPWLLPVAVQTLVVLAWFYGDAREPTALRLFLPSAVLMALSPLLVLCLCRDRLRPWLTAALGGLALLAVVLAAPERQRRGVLAPPLAVRVLAGVDAALAAVPFDPERTVLVGTVAQYLLVRGFAAVPPRAVGQRGLGNATEVWFVETALDAQLQSWFGDPAALARGYRAETVYEVGGDLPVRLSRVRR
jgi:hypothetical protein